MRAVLITILAAVAIVMAPAMAEHTPVRMTCTADPAGDVVVDGPEEPTAGELQDADILRLCAWLERSGLHVVLTNAAGGPDMFITELVEVYVDLDGDGAWDRRISSGFGGGSGELSSTTYDRAGTRLCDDLRFMRTFANHAVAPAACLGDPDSVTVGAVFRDARYRPTEPDSPTFTDAVAGGEAPALAVHAGPRVARLLGEDVIAIGIAWSQATFGDGDPDRALLARADNHADALASGVLQGHLDAPLLFTSSAALDPRVRAELGRLGVSRVTVLGGDRAVSDSVVGELRADGYEVDRIAGPTRYHTAAAIVEGIEHLTGTVLVRGSDDPEEPTRAWADSLAAGAFTAADPFGIGGVLLTAPDELPAPSAERWSGRYVIGGQEAVSDAVAAQGSAEEQVRLAGPERAATAAAVAAYNRDPAYIPDELDDGRILLVDGTSPVGWASGFAAAAHAARFNAAVLLTAGDQLPDATVAAIESVEDPARPPTIVCGPEVADGACTAALELLSGD